MNYRNDLGIWGNLSRLFTERNRQENEIQSTNARVSEGQAETDELMLDHEERLILLEVGEL